MIRWFLDGTRVKQLAADNKVSLSTGYAYLHEGIEVLAAHAPGLESALLAAKMAGYAHVNIDGTLIETDRCRTPGPTPGVDLWWSGKHDNHGGNIQVITAPDGWPLWTSPVRPGREHDTTALREHGILPLLSTWTGDDLRVLGDLGYEGEADHDHGRVQEAPQRRLHRRAAAVQPGPQRCPRHRRTRKLPAQDHLQSATQRQPVPMEHRQDHRSRPGPPPHRPRPHNLITPRHDPLRGKAQWLSGHVASHDG